MRRILPVLQMPIPGFKDLQQISESEGYRFLVRLEQDWHNGKNQFSKTGEALYQVSISDQLIGIGGINIDPYQPALSQGRLRRFYIHPDWRRQGIGQQLLQHILDKHKPYFESITLKTDTPSAALFYEKNGFTKVASHPSMTHIWRNA